MKKKIWTILSIFLLFNQNFLTTFAETDLNILIPIQTVDDISGHSGDMLDVEPLSSLHLSPILT